MLMEEEKEDNTDQSPQSKKNYLSVNLHNYHWKSERFVHMTIHDALNAILILSASPTEVRIAYSCLCVKYHLV